MEELFNNLQFSNIIWQVITPLIFSGLDILTGYIQAVINKNVDSKVMREGLLHKCLLIVAIVIGYVVQYAFNLNFVAQAITIYICIMEVMSILENLKKAGLDLGKLGDILKNKEEVMGKHLFSNVRVPIEEDNPSIYRDESRCINCGACKNVCKFNVGVYGFYDLEKTDNKIKELIDRRYDTIIMTNELASFSGDIIKKYSKDRNISIIIAQDKE